MPKPESHLTVWIDALITALPTALAIEWKGLQKKFFNRKPSIWERFAIIFLGTALSIYLFYFIFNLGGK